MRITVLDRQSLFDLAVQAAGSMEAAFAMAMLNDMSITGDLEPGCELALPPVVNREIANYFSNRQLKPATSLTVDDFIEDGIFDNIFDNPFE